VVDLAMEGEGEEWTNSQRLWLVDESGETLLHTADADGPKMRDQYPRRKCD
jgi:hypothetical protein